MSYPIRYFQPGVYFLTNRTLHGRLFMLPTTTANQIIGGVLARAVQRFSVRLYAFVFLANHMHVLAAAPNGRPGQLSAFMQYLESNIARKLGQHIGWSGKFWQRRFSCEPVLDDDALIGRFRYVLAHGVKEGLVETAAQWPGLTCIPELAHGVRRRFPWIDATARFRARCRGEDDREHLFTTEYTLELAVLPMWHDLPDAERQDLVKDLIRDVETAARTDRGDKPALGLHRILEQDPLSRPERSKRSPRPLCHASTRAAYNAFKAAIASLAEAYAEASALFRAGHANTDFPAFTFRPPVPFAWRAAGPPVAAAV